MPLAIASAELSPVVDLETVSTVFAQREHRITSTEALRLGESMAKAMEGFDDLVDEDEEDEEESDDEFEDVEVMLVSDEEALDN